MSESTETKVPVTFNFPITLNRDSESTQKWGFPENAVKSNWYIAIYFSDKTPYALRYDGTFWRDSNDRIAAVPMRIIPIPPPPVLKKTYKDEE